MRFAHILIASVITRHKARRAPVVEAKHGEAAIRDVPCFRGEGVLTS